MAEYPSAPVPAPGALRLCGVFHDPCSGALGQREQPLHLGRLAIEVHRDHRPRPRRQGGLGSADVDQVRIIIGAVDQDGVAPARDTASAVAMKVFAGMMHSSPGPTPSARSAISIASVPFATPTQCRAPVKVAYSDSNAATWGRR